MWKIQNSICSIYPKPNKKFFLLLITWSLENLVSWVFSCSTQLFPKHQRKAAVGPGTEFSPSFSQLWGAQPPLTLRSGPSQASPGWKQGTISQQRGGELGKVVHEPQSLLPSLDPHPYPEHPQRPPRELEVSQQEANCLICSSPSWEPLLTGSPCIPSSSV